MELLGKQKENNLGNNAVFFWFKIAGGCNVYQTEKKKGGKLNKLTKDNIKKTQKK